MGSARNRARMAQVWFAESVTDAMKDSRVFKPDDLTGLTVYQVTMLGILFNRVVQQSSSKGANQRSQPNGKGTSVA